MQTHLGRCTAYDHDKTQATKPNKRRKTNSEGKVVCSPSYSKFDQEECQALLVKTFVCCELPFCFVKNEVFRKLLITLQPQFYIPSRSTLRLDILVLQIYVLVSTKLFPKDLMTATPSIALLKSVVMTFQLFDDDDQSWRHLKPHLV